MPNPTSSTMNHHGPSSLANGILFYAEKSTLKGKNLDNLFQHFPKPSTSCSIFSIYNYSCQSIQISGSTVHYTSFLKKYLYLLSLMSYLSSICGLPKCAIVKFCCYCCCQSCLILQSHGLQPARLLCLWNFPVKNIRVGRHFLLQGIFLTQELNPCLLHQQVDSLPLNHQGSPGKFHRTLKI